MTNETKPDDLSEEAVIDPSESEDDESEQSTRYSISSYGADYTADGFVTKLRKEDIFIPDFQRGYVWSNVQASRFIESLILGLPVPGVFLFRQADTQKLLVVDGQQRLRSLVAFYDAVLSGREFVLKGVTTGLSGASYKTLKEPDRRRLDDAIIHATIFKQEDPSDNENSVYEVFQRLNTGGTPLVPQEIRSCIFLGPLNDTLGVLAADQNWRSLYGKPSRRGKDRELILRFFALYFDLPRYHRPMVEFLNEFMGQNRKLEKHSRADLTKVFTEAMAHAAKYLTPQAVRPERAYNAALADAVLVGLATRLKRPLVHPDQLAPALQHVAAQTEFLKLYTKGTTDPASLEKRIALVTTAFDAVQ